jgi:NAD(P)-dependent dehydrogenase (short-subunit alcohol dehydrogenase family)
MRDMLVHPCGAEALSMSTLGLDGKIAAVTGSTRGWGRGIACELAARGVRVVVTGTQAEAVGDACDAIRRRGGIAAGVVVDLMERDGPSRVVDTAIAEFGGIDILVNNAGALAHAPLWEMSDEQWESIVELELTAQFRACRHAVRQMIKAGRGGRIINMVGGGGFTGFFHNANHCAAKGGGMGAVLTWAMELAPYGITINGLAGSIESDQSRPYLAKAREILKESAQIGGLSAREMGSYPAEEAAAIVVWLASEPAKEVSGQFFEIAGPTVTLWRMATIERSFHHYPCWTPELLEQAGLAQLAGGPPRIEPSVVARTEFAVKLHG